MINHTINHNVATASNGEILQYQVQHSNISLAFNQTNLNAAVLISFHWSNNGTNKAPYLKMLLMEISAFHQVLLVLVQELM